jgi:cell division protease FtsH
MAPDSTVEETGSPDDKTLVNPFLRSALFPLVVVVLLVYLASQTLLPTHSKANRVEYGQLLTRVEANPQAVRKITFTAETRLVEADFRDDERLKATYTTEASAFALEQRMRSAGVRVDSRRSGGSAWWSILTYLMPFALFAAFWIFLMKRQREREQARQDELADQSGGTSRY